MQGQEETQVHNNGVLDDIALRSTERSSRVSKRRRSGEESWKKWCQYPSHFGLANIPYSGLINVIGLLEYTAISLCPGQIHWFFPLPSSLREMSRFVHQGRKLCSLCWLQSRSCFILQVCIKLEVPTMSFCWDHRLEKSRRLSYSNMLLY